jgi:hypothetical protein
MNAACGGALECKRADPPMMMPSMSMCSYAGAADCGSALECIAVVFDRTCASV